jgi:hypothetical protein
MFTSYVRRRNYKWKIRTENSRDFLFWTVCDFEPVHIEFDPDPEPAS